jgi:hypothetical protein
MSFDRKVQALLVMGCQRFISKHMRIGDLSQVLARCIKTEIVSSSPSKTDG